MSGVRAFVNAMTSSIERTSAEAESSRLPHREVADGLPPPLEEGMKQPISVLEQILRSEGVS